MPFGPPLTPACSVSVAPLNAAVIADGQASMMGMFGGLRSSRTSADIAAAPPITAYAGLRAADPGSTNDRRVASYERARSVSGTAAGRANAPHVRTSVIGHAPASGAPVAGPSGSGSIAAPDATMVKMLVHVFPFKVRIPLASVALAVVRRCLDWLPRCPCPYLSSWL